MAMLIISVTHAMQVIKMTDGMVTLHASQDLSLDRRKSIYMAPYQISFWELDGDPSGERLFEHLRVLLEKFEKKQLAAFPAFDRVVKSAYPTKLARAQRLEETISRLKTSFREKLKIIRKEYRHHSVEVPYYSYENMELVAYPDVAFFEKVQEGDNLHLPLLGMFANEPSPGQSQEENITPSYHPMYNTQFTEYANTDDFTLYNFIAQFRIYMKLIRDVNRDEELCWCYGRKYDRVGYEPAAKCTVRKMSRIVGFAGK